MSTLTVDTLTNQEVQLCKAWVNFDGTGTVAIKSSYNVSSITDNGTGLYEVNFTIAMADVNYAGLASSIDPLFNSVALVTYIDITDVNSAQFTSEGSNGNRYNKSGFYAAFFGN